MAEAGLRCVFFDRDGIVNESPGPGYVERVEDFHLQEGFVAAARMTQSKGYGVAVITNQRGVARGIMSMKVVEQIHGHLVAELKARGISLLGIYCCPHDRDVCDCRKPLPGMLLQAAADHGIDLANSWMVGDNESDVKAGHAAGCKAVRVAPLTESSAAEVRVATMPELPEVLARLL
jgi:D-glycero-D-manno-heptose 1,7-bisphosphate phosphatase